MKDHFTIDFIEERDIRNICCGDYDYFDNPQEKCNKQHLTPRKIKEIPSNSEFEYKTVSEHHTSKLSKADIDLTEVYYVYNMLKTLDHLKTLKNGWDGYDAIAIEEDSYDNTKKAIEKLSSKEINYFCLFPNTNGTLILSAKGDFLASINIGNENYSYFALGKDGRDVKGEKHFNEKNFKKTIKEIEDVLGWK